MSAFSRGVLKLFGWRVESKIPDGLNKFVVIAVPHTSAWDFPLGLLARAAIDRDIKYLGKKSLFKPPFGWIMKALGGYPVDRSAKSNLVDAVVDLFNRKEEFMIAIAPEGTRRKVDKFKTGFYYIARGANVPIILSAFDYENRVVSFSEPFYPGDDPQADLDWIWEYYRGIKGKHPELSVH